MMIENFVLNSNYDDLELSCIATIPEGTPTAILQIAHGMCEHKERYLDFMEFMTDNGFACVIHDHRGHGKSVKTSEDLGYMYGAGEAGLLRDTRQLTEYVKDRWPKVPVILFGHSMGSLVVRCYAKRWDDMISQLVVCGAPCKNGAVGIAKSLARREAKKRGPKVPSTSLTKLTLGAYDKKFPGRPNSWLSVNERNVEMYNEDPECGFMFTPDAFTGLFELLADTYSKKDWVVTNPDLPIFFVAGEDDPCIGGAKKFKQSIDFMREMGYKQVKGRLFPDMRHEILNETEHRKVYKAIYRQIISCM